MEAAAQDAGAVVEIAAACKSTKYSALDSRTFQGFVVESLGLINKSAKTFLGVLGRRIAEISGDS